jgi:hypothetical protein
VLISARGLTVVFSHNWRSCANGRFRAEVVIEAKPATTKRTVRFELKAAGGNETVASSISITVAELAMPVTTTTTTRPTTTTIPPTTTTTAPLATADAISGGVTDASSKPIVGVTVAAFTTGGNPVEVGSARTAADGSYEMTSLDPGTYFVCFLAGTAVGPSPTGYLDQCYDNVPWTGTGNVVPTSTTVTVSNTSVTSGVDAELQFGGAIAGAVTDASGQPLANATVSVMSASAQLVGGGAVTGADGTYSVLGLPAGSYYVCFSGPQPPPPTAPGGYLTQCYNTYKNVNWDGPSGNANGATALTVTLGQAITGIDGQLVPTAGISGTVTGFTPNLLGGASVFVYSAGAQPALIASVLTTQSGSFLVTGLTSGSYYVCFSSPGYTNECYNQATPWVGYPGPPAPRVDFGKRGNRDSYKQYKRNANPVLTDFLTSRYEYRVTLSVAIPRKVMLSL